jgi:hypothetical protein
MSFPIDPPWLFASDSSRASLTPERAHGRTPAAIGAARLGAFWAPSVSPYLDHRRAGPLTHAVSSATFATYPLWLWHGRRGGWRA